MIDVGLSAYVTGMVDADGHICWRGGKYNAPNVGVTTTSEDLVRWLLDRIGGSACITRRTCAVECDDTAPTHFHRRADIWKWHVTGERACIILRAMRPYLIIKGDKADEVMELYTDHLKTMQRPARREHHIAKERLAMAGRGWD